MTRTQLRRGGFSVAALICCLGVVAGCSSPSTTNAGAGSKASPSPKPAAKVAMNPTNGSDDFNPAKRVRLSVSNGKLHHIVLKNSAGKTVKSDLAADGKSWKSAEDLGYGKHYLITGTATSNAGRTTAVKSSFTTLKPKSQITGRLNIADGSKVGVGAPLIVQFDGHITHKADVERSLKLKTSNDTEGSWAWLPDTAEGSRLHWRPKSYWKPGTKVSMDGSLYGVNFGDGAYGGADLSSHFTIGRQQIIKGAVNSYRMKVYRSGKLVMNVPASYGLGTDPGRATHNGTSIVMDKRQTVYMSNPKYGYKNVEEHWAVRFSNNGEFIHANPESVGSQGSANVTHGCINLSTENAQAFFNQALYGDPVEITGSQVPLTAADGDIYDWTLSWSKWKSMSALS